MIALQRGKRLGSVQLVHTSPVHRQRYRSPAQLERTRCDETATDWSERGKYIPCPAGTEEHHSCVFFPRNLMLCAAELCKVTLVKPLASVSEILRTLQARAWKHGFRHGWEANHQKRAPYHVSNPRLATLRTSRWRARPLGHAS